MTAETALAHGLIVRMPEPGGALDAALELAASDRAQCAPRRRGGQAHAPPGSRPARGRALAGAARAGGRRLPFRGRAGGRGAPSRSGGHPSGPGGKRSPQATEATREAGRPPAATPRSPRRGSPSCDSVTYRPRVGRVAPISSRTGRRWTSTARACWGAGADHDGHHGDAAEAGGAVPVEERLQQARCSWPCRWEKPPRRACTRRCRPRRPSPRARTSRTARGRARPGRRSCGRRRPAPRRRRPRSRPLRRRRGSVSAPWGSRRRRRRWPIRLRARPRSAPRPVSPASG